MTALRSYSVQSVDLSLLVAAYSGAAPVMAKVSLPIAGSPIDDLISAGPHRFATGAAVTLGTGTINPYCRLHLLDEGFGDRASKKILHQHALNTEGLGGSTKLTFEDRADPAPGSTTFTTSTDVTTSPQQEITPATVVSGNRLERRISFVSPSGGATPAVIGVLDAVRTTAIRKVPSLMVRTFTVEWGDGVLDLSGADDSNNPNRNPVTVGAALEAATKIRTTIRSPDDLRWRVTLEQVMEQEIIYRDSGTWGQTRRVRLEASVLAGPL